MVIKRLIAGEVLQRLLFIVATCPHVLMGYADSTTFQSIVFDDVSGN